MEVRGEGLGVEVSVLQGFTMQTETQFVEKLLPCRNNDNHIVVDYFVLKGEIARDTISTHISGPESI